MFRRGGAVSAYAVLGSRREKRVTDRARPADRPAQHQPAKADRDAYSRMLDAMLGAVLPKTGHCAPRVSGRQNLIPACVSRTSQTERNFNAIHQTVDNPVDKSGLRAEIWPAFYTQVFCLKRRHQGRLNCVSSLANSSSYNIRSTGSTFDADDRPLQTLGL